MFFSSLFILCSLYFPLFCLGVKKNNDAHKITFTGNKNDLCNDTSKNPCEKGRRLLNILDSHNLSRKDHVKNMAGKMVTKSKGPVSQSRSNIGQILANRVTMFTDVINISIVWIWHTTIKAFSIPFHRCWFDLFANTVPGWGTLYSVYFLLLDVEEFVFSSWYFLIFYIINSSRGSLPIDVSSLTLEIANGLADKLSVPSSVFIVNNVHKANLW